MSKLKPFFLLALILVFFYQCEQSNNSLSTTQQSGDNLTESVSYPSPGDLVRPDSDHDFQDVEVDVQVLANSLMWRDFIALNWPASTDENQRGEPDLGNTIGGLGSGGINPTFLPAGPTVWETFKSTNDVFITNPYEVPDTSFNAPPIVPDACSGSSKALARRSKISDVVTEIDQAFSNAPLIDQNGNYVWYEVMYNRTAFEYVIDNKFYNADNQKGANISFPKGNNETPEVGAMRVKAAWKIFDWNKDKGKEDYFYLSKGYVYDAKADTCDTVTLALVGMHIVHKIKSRPEWIWGTFEHMYNCPDTAGWPELPDGWKAYNFNDNSGQGPYNVKPDSGSTKPVQVQRTTVIPDQVKALNESYQNMLRSISSSNVWQYYMLVDAQWPTDTGDTEAYGSPRPDYLANTVIETYLQGPTGSDTSEPHSCMGCHGKFAANTDFGFQLQGAGSPSSEQINSIAPTFFSDKLKKEESEESIPINKEDVATIQEIIKDKKPTEH